MSESAKGTSQAIEAYPIYTILIPLYKEAEVVSDLLEHLERMDYPVENLDIKILLEPDDTETICRLREIQTSLPIEILVAPETGPRTKPRACNIGLEQARGDLLVIYDSEDRPEPDQLKKAVAAFRTADSETVCLQCILDYHNPRQNRLTRFFTVEYACWFRLFLPGLHRFGMPIPLGGTSNHFKTGALRDLGGWDAYNLTEDCDLGIRIHAAGLRTAILSSTTWEEANSRVGNWLRQRSRWCKGYIQTFLVFTRNPLRSVRTLGVKGFAGFFLTVGGFTAILLLNPIYWIVTAFYLAFRWQILYPDDPVSVFFAVASATLFATNFLFIAINILAVRKKREKGLLAAAILSPLYWVLISIGAWKGFIQLFTQPFYWEKTRHGLDKS